MFWLSGYCRPGFVGWDFLVLGGFVQVEVHVEYVSEILMNIGNAEEICK